MRALSFVAASVAMLAGIFSTPASAEGVAGQFDYYVLALSWSPTFCSNEKTAKRNEQQCGVEKHYAFVVHGLWPQYEKANGGKRWPESCASTEPATVPGPVRDSVLGIMPSNSLIEHEWDKHGTCSGLSQPAYFKAISTVYSKLVIPDAFKQAETIQTTTPDKIEDAFRAANSGLASDAISLSCQKKRLQEVRICLNKDLSFRSCPELEAKSCRSPQLTLPAKR